MTTTILVWDDTYVEREKSSPTADDVNARITALDGVDHTLVTIYRDDAHIAVGGSASTGLVVYCTFDNEVFWQLVGEGDSHSSIQVCAGGQLGLYPANQVTTVDRALLAATNFLVSGGRATGLRWEAQ